MLPIWFWFPHVPSGRFNICAKWGYWMDGTFLMNHLCFSRSAAFKLHQESLEHTTSPKFRGILKGLLEHWRLWHTLRGQRYLHVTLSIPETYAPELTWDQDNHNIFNLNCLTRFSRLEVLTADQITSLFLLYVHAIIWHRRLSVPYIVCPSRERYNNRFMLMGKTIGMRKW